MRRNTCWTCERRVGAEELLEVKLAMLDNLRGKRWDASYESSLGRARACGLNGRDMTEDTLTASMGTCN
jgi:hypothetical protein